MARSFGLSRPQFTQTVGIYGKIIDQSRTWLGHSSLVVWVYPGLSLFRLAPTFAHWLGHYAHRHRRYIVGFIQENPRLYIFEIILFTCPRLDSNCHRVRLFSACEIIESSRWLLQTGRVSLLPRNIYAPTPGRYPQKQQQVKTNSLNHVALAQVVKTHHLDRFWVHTDLA